jgi:tetratricopeptide (TPR) repeat protein
MAPEQAAADPSIDHRADIYAFGCMAYEMVVGRPPFSATTPQRLLAAHMSETPAPIDALRPETPRALSDLITRCLAKEPEARPQSAADLLAALNSVSSGQSDVSASGLLRGRGTLRRALGIYAVTGVAAIALVRTAVTLIGLPDWVVPAAIVVLVLVLPLILFTGYAQRVVRRTYTATPTFTPGGTRATQTHGTLATLALEASPHLSWKRTVRWSVVAGGAFVLVVVASMAMRAGGIGPFATLLSAGQLQRDRPVVVAEFAMNNSNDTTLGRVISDAVRADLSQSGAITLLDEAEAGRTLVAMQRPKARMLLPVAQEVARRSGSKAVIDGSLNPLGAGFVVTLRMVTADSGRELASFTDAANSPAELIRVVGGLTRRLRGKIGESLKSVRSSPPLWQVTTSSLPALEKYMEGRRAVNSGRRDDYDRLLREAVQLDTNFAAAYISLASNNINANANWTETTRYLAKVHSLRDRLGDRDRWSGENFYYTFGPVATRDYARAAVYADSEKQRFTTGPFGALAANSEGLRLEARGDTRAADSVFHLAMARDPDAAYAVGNTITVALIEGRLAAAESTFLRAAPHFSRDVVAGWQQRLWLASGDLTRAESSGVARLAKANAPRVRATAAGDLLRIMGHEGRLAEAQRNSAIRAEATVAAGIPTARISEAAAMAESIIWMTADTAAAVRVLDDALARDPLESVEDLDRPYAALASAYALAGRPQRARTYFDALVRQRTEGERSVGWRVPVARAQIAMAEKRWDDAVKAVSGPIAANCRTCVPLVRGMAYDDRGNADSAIVWYERFMTPLPAVGVAHAPIARRLGELYEAKGDLPHALKWYEEFLSTWKRADPVLQPQVADVRQRVIRLHARERAAR